MNIDAELMQQLIETFQVELDEQLEIITKGLLTLEKGGLDQNAQSQWIDSIFRAAHNIKGTSRALSINSIGEIAHHIESLFSDIQKNHLAFTPGLIDLCLESVDKMRAAMLSFVEKKEPTFDVTELLQRLQHGNLEDKEGKAQGNAVTVHKERFDDNKSTPEKNSADSIRIPIKKIENIYSLMEEIQVNKIAIDDFYEEIVRLRTRSKELLPLWKGIQTTIKSQHTSTDNEGLERLLHATNDHVEELTSIISKLQKNMRSQLNEFSIISSNLQEEIRTLRLIPISNTLYSLPRYVRDLSQELHKQVELDILGGEVKMDKMVLELLKDPIIHLLRNAIDHGIETPDERKNKGKPPTGHITIDIKDEGNQVCIDISDDGQGIDLKKITAVIKEKSLASPEELAQMKENDILEFIFKPSFSTKELITSISGRGVGLDVVRNNLAAVKGQVSVKTMADKGSTFSLRLPLTLSSERGVLVKSGGQLWVIPTQSIEHVWIVSSHEIVNLEGAQSLLIDKHPVMLCTLSAVLSLGPNEPIKNKQLPIVVLKKGLQSVAFLVDEIIGEREIVLKPLTKPLSRLPCVSGGTLLERNQVVIVLNPNDLVNLALSNNKQPITIHSENMETVEIPHILVVDDSITTRTLEKNILEARNYKVTVAVNGKEAWDLLQKQKFSLMITDVVMPLMDGFVLTDQVKKENNLRDMPVIIVTSLGSEDEKARGIEVGADAYIVKNEFESGALLEIVEQLV